MYPILPLYTEIPPLLSSSELKRFHSVDADILIHMKNRQEKSHSVVVQLAEPTRVLPWFLQYYRHASYRERANDCGISKSLVARICYQNPAASKKITSDATSRGGRPCKVSKRSVRKLLRALKELGSSNRHTTVKSLVQRSGFSFEMASHRTFSRYLNENRYHYLRARKTGLLSENDRKLQVRFAKKMKHLVAENPHFWSNEVAFYLDAVSFVHKYNPQSGATMNRSWVWQQKGEGLQLTTKGLKELPGGRRLHVVIAIVAGKGVILCVPYNKMSGHFFADFITTHFNITFARAGPKRNGRKLFVMGNDASLQKRLLMMLRPNCLNCLCAVHCIANAFNFAKVV